MIKIIGSILEAVLAFSLRIDKDRRDLKFHILSLRTLRPLRAVSTDLTHHRRIIFWSLKALEINKLIAVPWFFL